MTSLVTFERLVRSAHLWTEEAATSSEESASHPFELRNLHPDLPPKVRRLFDDGYYAESTFETFKFIEKEVKRLARLRGITGFALMMKAFDEQDPAVKLNDLLSDSQVDEQKGFRHIFAGAQAGIRNPRGHDTDLHDSPDTCLDHLSLASILLRRLDDAGIR